MTSIIRKAWSTCIGVLHARLIPVLALLLCGGVVVMVWHVSSLQSSLVKAAALQNAGMYSKALAAFRTLYTSEVVNTVRARGVEVAHDYQDRNGAIPLPATLSMKLGELIGSQEGGAKSSLYSPYPFPWRRKTGGLKDPFATEAWDHLTRHPDQPFYRFEGGTLRYATADVLRPSCVNCHNSHPESPKADWKAGDVRGVLEVNMPLDSFIAQTRAGLRGTTFITIAMASVGLLAISLVFSRMQRSAGELEQRVQQRTQELTDSEKRVRMIVEASHEAFVSMDEQGLIAAWNSQAERTFGWPCDQAVGKPLAETIIAPSDRQAYRERLAGLRHPGQSQSVGTTIELTALHRDGCHFPIELSVSPLEVGSRWTLNAFARDISQRKRVEREQLQGQKLESIGHLAAGIAHEINTPTQYVGDNVRFLKDTFGSLLAAMDAYESALNGSGQAGGAAPDLQRRLAELDLAFLRDEIPKAIDQSLEGLGQVSSIVLAMKEFSHPGSAEKAPADLNAAILSTVTVCRNRWKYVARLETALAAELPLVPCLVAEFNQVILNLVVNAADAIVERFGEGGADRGLIRVSTRKAASSVEVSVSDNGAGIPAEIRGRIFDPFFTTKRIGKGTGQGLAISRSVIVDKHDGTIDCASQPGVGTTFTIRLPREPVASGASSAVYDPQESRT